MRTLPATSLSDSAPRGVLVTRPQPDADETGRLLAARGFDPVIAPVMVLHERPVQPLGRFDAVVTASRNAIGGLPDRLKPVTLLAVGSATAARARAAGFTTVLDADGDAAALTRLAQRRLDPGSRVLLAHGLRQGDALADALGGAGFDVVRACSYAVQPARRLPTAATAALEAGTLAAALFLSAETAQNFVRLLPPRQAPALAVVRALVIGERVGNVLAGLPWRDVRVAFKPTLDDVLALL